MEEVSKSSPTAIHHTSLFQYCLGMYKAHGMVDMTKLDSTIRILSGKTKTVFKYQIGSTSGTANICYTHEKSPFLSGYW